MRGPIPAIYRFGDGVISDDDIRVDGELLHVPGYESPVDLRPENPYEDMAP